MKKPIKFELSFFVKNPTLEDILNEILRVDALLNGETLTRKYFDAHSKISSSAITKKFGDWGLLLEKAGIGHKYSGRTVSTKMKKQKSRGITNQEVIDELKRISVKLDTDIITQNDIKNHSEIIGNRIIWDRFGTLEEALKQAGLKSSDNYRRKYSNEEYFENLFNVWEFHSRQPLLREMNETPSTISSGAYEGRFGSWRKSLEAFVEFINQDEAQENQDVPMSVNLKPKKSIPIEKPKGQYDRHGIGLGLRFKVLQRDSFKCTKCGNSPATDHSCKLHVDHVLPFSKGGKTVLDNLQTLCKSCNLGKGNRFEE